MSDYFDVFDENMERGECMYCGAEDGMENQGVCFVCSVCGRSCATEIYETWYEGGDIQVLNDDGEYETIYGR